MTDFPDRLRGMIDAYLARLDDEHPAARDPQHAAFQAAAAYPLQAGGKRLRPVLVLATVEAVGADPADALATAAALEWIHTFSLVHDDLPALDDDAVRRGRPTTHVVYGDDVAILVGDLLLAGAFRLVADHQTGPADRRLRAVSALAAGCEEMIRGQFLDLRPPATPDEAWLRAMCSLKTGSLVRAAIDAGLALAGADEQTSRSYRAFANELGVGFQIVDDVLDATGSDETLGKPAGSDAAHGKQTYVTVLGLDEARRLADESYARCRTLVDALPGEPRALAAISERVYRRQS